MLIFNVILLSGLSFVYASSNSRIIGGEVVNEGQFPFIVSIQWMHHTTNIVSHGCGGSLLNSLWVLSAAHCVYRKSAEDDLYQVFLGWNNLNETENGVIIKVKEFVINNFNFQKVKNDIALLKLEEEVKFTDHIQPVTLALDYDGDKEMMAQLIGWGSLQYLHDTPNKLHYVDLVVFTQDYCESRDYKLPFFCTNLCAGSKGGGKGQCNGDSGGPLIVNGRQLGIVSWSEKVDYLCSPKEYPGVFTSVPSYVDWISVVVGNINLN